MRGLPYHDTEPLYPQRRSVAFPPGITVEGATPAGEGRCWILACTTSPSPVAYQRQKIGGRSHHHLPLRAAPRRALRGGGHTMPQTRGALRPRTRAIRANPLPMRIPGLNLDHNGEDFAL